ncbi:uncharacterized protein BDR25DRAFT_154105, partial [Lindgomyces ingoldianus]
AAIFVVAASLALYLRFVARRIQKVRWGWDDGLILSAALFLYSLIACCLVDVYGGGVGYHRSVVEQSASKIRVLAKMAIVLPIFYLPAAALPKLSIICLYLRIFHKQTNPIQRKICWITAILVVANCIGSMIPAFVACRPLSYLWMERKPGDPTHCIDFNAWYRWGSIMNVITDIVMIFLPIPVIWKLSSSRSVKISLSITFALGSLGVVTSIIRFVGFFKTDSHSDGTWNATNFLILTTVECGMYFISACLLAMKPI